MKNTKKYLTFLMVLLTLASVSCGGEATASAGETESAEFTETLTAQTETAETTALYDTQGKQYDGYTFRMWYFDNVKSAGWTGIPSDIDVDTETGDILNDAVYNRNKMAEELLNITIEAESKLEINDVQKAVMAQSNDVDLFFPREYDLVSLVSGKYLVDLASVDAFNGFSDPWWQKTSVDSLTIHDKLYAVGSDLTFWDRLSTYAVFFNRKMVTDYDLGDMYALVESGEWTLDKMLELGDIVSQDVDNNGVYDGNDCYGVSCQNDGVYIFLHAAGLTICDRDADGAIHYNLEKDTHVNVLQAVYELMNDKKRYFNRQDNGYDLTAAINMLNENRTLFLIRPIQSLFMMREMNSDFGILPVPKYSAEQDTYYSSVNPYAAIIMTLPNCQEDAERSAVVASYLASLSSTMVSEPLYETVLGSKLIRDDRSADMLDIVFDGAVYDIGLIWDFGEIIHPTLLENRSTDVVSLLEKKHEKVEKAIEKLESVYLED